MDFPKGMDGRAFATVVALCVACARGTAPPMVPSRTGLPLEGVQATVVATLHSRHLTEAGYPLALLGEVLRVAAPDLVLVEIRPEAFASGHLEDGPLEMTYVTVVARAQGLAVAPIDWWLENDVGAHAPELSPDEQSALDRALAPFEAAYTFPAPWAVMQSPGQAAAILALHNAQSRLEGGNPSWNRRQAWFHQRAVEAIMQHRAHRVVAFVGADHRPELASYLGTQGATVLEPLSLGVTASALPPDARAPDAVLTAWREGLERLREASSGDSPYAAAMRRKVRSWSVAIEHEGRCCVPASTFAAP